VTPIWCKRDHRQTHQVHGRRDRCTGYLNPRRWWGKRS